MQDFLNTTPLSHLVVLAVMLFVSVFLLIDLLRRVLYMRRLRKTQNERWEQIKRDAEKVARFENIPQTQKAMKRKGLHTV